MKLTLTVEIANDRDFDNAISSACKSLILEQKDLQAETGDYAAIRLPQVTKQLSALLDVAWAFDEARAQERGKRKQKASNR